MTDLHAIEVSRLRCVAEWAKTPLSSAETIISFQLFSLYSCSALRISFNMKPCRRWDGAASNAFALA
jgi:hypothetical protein